MMNGNEKRDPCDDERDTKNQIEKNVAIISVWRNIQEYVCDLIIVIFSLVSESVMYMQAAQWTAMQHVGLA